jgi:hypothetical protein
MRFTEATKTREDRRAVLVELSLYVVAPTLIRADHEVFRSSVRTPRASTKRPHLPRPWAPLQSMATTASLQQPCSTRAQMSKLLAERRHERLVNARRATLRTPEARPCVEHPCGHTAHWTVKLLPARLDLRQHAAASSTRARRRASVATQVRPERRPRRTEARRGRTLTRAEEPTTSAEAPINHTSVSSSNSRSRPASRPSHLCIDRGKPRPAKR